MTKLVMPKIDRKLISKKSEIIANLKKINNLDGFLIGGASQNSKKFIDIVKKTYS